jgi:hypothetical protein
MKILPESARAAARCIVVCLVGLIAVMLTGCSTPIGGTTAISPGSTRGYHQGLTTKDDIVSELGPPARHSPDGGQIAYLWTTSIGISVTSDFWPLYTSPGPEYARVRYHAYCAAFDENHRLIRAEYLITKDAGGLDHLWQDWQARYSLDKPAVAQTP